MTTPIQLTDHAIDDMARQLRSDGVFDDFELWLDVEQAELVTVERDGAESQRLDADPTRRYRLVPQMAGPGGLRAFVRQLEDDELREAVDRAARGGRGAYRRVKETLHGHGAIQLWYDFEAAWDRKLVVEWLQQQGLALQPQT